MSRPLRPERRGRRRTGRRTRRARPGAGGRPARWRLARRPGTAIAAALLWLGQTGTAQAAETTAGQAPGALRWIELADTRGISVWNYELSLDRGGVTSPGHLIWSFLLDLVWGLYRGCVVVAVWFLDWVISFAWLPLVAAPVLVLGDSLQTIVDRFGVVPVFATAAAAVAVTWMARGRWAVGVFELAASLVIAALAVGVFADPVHKVAGDGGLIVATRDVGLQLSAGMANNGDINGGVSGGVSGNADVMRQQVTGTLVDTFIRMPTQMINFGEVLDGGACEAAYDDVLRAGPHGNDDDIRDAIDACDADLGEVAANPGPGQFASAVIISPAASLVVVFAIVLAGAVMLAAVHALYQALRLIVTVVLAVLPGAARGSLWQTLADLVMALVTMVFAVVFLTSYLVFIQGLFQSSATGAQGTMATFLLVDVMLAVGVILFWKGRKKLRRAADRLAAAMATRPGTGPTALPARRQLNPTELYHQGRMAATAGRVAVDGGRALGRGSVALGRGAGAAAGLATTSFTVLLTGVAGTLAGWAAGRGTAPAHPDAAAEAAWPGGQPGGVAQQLPGGPEGSTSGPADGSRGGPGGSGRGGGGGDGAGAGGGGGAAAAVRHRVAATRGRSGAGGKLLASAGQIAALHLTGGASGALQAGGHTATGAAAIQAARTARQVALASRLAVKSLPAGSSLSSGGMAATSSPAPGGPPAATAAATAAVTAAGAAEAPGLARSDRSPSTPSPSTPAPDTATSNRRSTNPAASSATARSATAPATASPAAQRAATTALAAATVSRPATGASARPGPAGRPTPPAGTATPLTLPTTASQTAPAAAWAARPPEMPVSGDVLDAPAKRPAPTDDRAARLRAELATRRYANTRTRQGGTGRGLRRPES
jgi:hypothetical protein